jgi:hypothetical protein
MKVIRSILSLLSIPAIALSGCSFGFTPGFSKEDIAEVELVKVDHPFLGKVLERRSLDTNLVMNFCDDLRYSNAIGLTKVFTCFVIHVKTKDGAISSFRTNGRIFSRVSDDRFYEFDGKENLVSKYWKANPNCT